MTTPFTHNPYKMLHKAQLTFEYLHANSTTHEFLFGAIAEMVDNSLDARSSKIEIHTDPYTNVRGGFVVGFLDDGTGMDHVETLGIVSFGKSNKRGTGDCVIGQFGNGLKSGSMRLGNDMIVFTKKGTTLTCLMLSRTFHETEGIGEVVVPLPIFDVRTREPFLPDGKSELVHEFEMDLIFRYSPFTNHAEFMRQFDKIDSKSGTLVVIYNLKLISCGLPELDVDSLSDDIVIRDGEQSFEEDMAIKPESRSLRSYLSILYYNPSMRIVLRGKKVQCKLLVHELYRPLEYVFQSSRFKNRAETELNNARNELKRAEDRIKETESKVYELNTCMNANDENVRFERGKLRLLLDDQKKVVEKRRARVARRQAILEQPKELKFCFGVNLQNRLRDGAFVYNSNRLIRMYERSHPGSTTENRHHPGIVAVINIPANVIEPTHNKQSFADAREYRFLLKALFDFMLYYVCEIDYYEGNQDLFWQKFGYPDDDDWTKTFRPSDEPEFVERRNASLDFAVQCDLCMKWRKIPRSALESQQSGAPDSWHCEMNPDEKRASCDAPDDKFSIKRGTISSVTNRKLSRPVKSTEVKPRTPKTEPFIINERKLRQPSSSLKPSPSVRPNHCSESPVRDGSNPKSERLASQVRLALKGLLTNANEMDEKDIDRMTIEDLVEMNACLMVEKYADSIRVHMGALKKEMTEFKDKTERFCKQIDDLETLEDRADHK